MEKIYIMINKEVDLVGLKEKYKSINRY